MEARTPPTRDPWLYVVAIGALAAALAAHHRWYDAVGDTTDASIYVACARSIVAGDGYAYLGEPFTIRPPGFSALLAPWIASGASFGALNAIGAASVVLLAVATFAWARERIGALLAAAAALALAANPGVQRLQNQVLSDLPGACLLVGALVLARGADRKPSRRAELALAIWIGAACYVRTQTSLLVPAIVVARAFAQRPRASELPAFLRRNALLLVVPALLVAPWSLRNARVERVEPAEQTLLHSYSTAMWRSDLHDPSSPRLSAAEILERVPTRSREILGAIGDRMRGGEPDATAIALGAAFCALAALGAWLRRTAADFVWLATVAVMLVYFGFQTRLVLPLIAIGSVAALDALSAAIARFAPRRVATPALAACLIALAAADWAPRESWPEIEARHKAFEATARSLNDAVPRELAIATTVGWHLAVFADRPIHSLIFVLRRQGAAGAEASFDRHRIGHAVVAPWNPQDRALAAHLEARYGVVSSDAFARVYRVR